MRVAVTGSRGFIASHLLAALDPRRMSTLGIDELEGLDVRDQLTADVLAEFEPDVIVHLAARHFVPWCREHPDETWDVNRNGTEALVRTAAALPGLRAFVLASSAAVYGFADTRRREDHPTRPADVYGRSKVAAEQVIEHLAELRPEVRCVAARLFNVIGPGDRTPHLFPELARQIRDGRTTVKLGNLDSRRDYVHAADVARALVMLAVGAPSGFNVYNVTSAASASAREVLWEFEQRSGKTFTVEPTEGLERSLDGDLMGSPVRLQMLGWRARLTIADAIAELLEGDR
jgi:UDP-glucose 4-epimerase